MIEEIKLKIRSLIEDLLKSDYETFEYYDTNIFTLSEENIVELTAVLVNGEELGSGDYSFNSTTNKIEILTSGLGESDNIEVDYTYYKYSDSELTAYMRSAIAWMSLYGYGETDYEIEDDGIYPTPDNRTTDIIAIISSILINPDYTRYQLPNSVTVVYNAKMTKYQKIQSILDRFVMGTGELGLIVIDEEDNYHG